jgi:hypothetical protein
MVFLRLEYDPYKLSLEADPSQNRGSASRIHQHTAQKRRSASRIHQPKRGSASRFHQLDGGPPLEFINIQPPKRGSASRIHMQPPIGGPPLEFINIQPQNGGSASRIHQHQPKNGGPPLGTISMDLAVPIEKMKILCKNIDGTINTYSNVNYDLPYLQ